MRIGVSRLNEWATLQLPNIADAPDSARLSFVKIVSDHAFAIGGELPPAVQTLIGKSDLDAEWVEEALNDVADAPSREQLLAYAGSGAVKTRLNRLAQERPDLHERLEAAIANRLMNEFEDSGETKR
jgi:hypothetical protein